MERLSIDKDIISSLVCSPFTSSWRHLVWLLRWETGGDCESSEERAIVRDILPYAPMVPVRYTVYYYITGVYTVVYSSEHEMNGRRYKRGEHHELLLALVC